MDEMFLIYDIKCGIVPAKPTEVYVGSDFKSKLYYNLCDQFPLEDVMIVGEIVAPRYYNMFDGEKLVKRCIGLTDNVEQKLGIHFEMIEQLEEKIHEMSSNNKKLFDKLNCVSSENDELEEMVCAYEEMTLWQRFKFLIFGKAPWSDDE